MKNSDTQSSVTIDGSHGEGGGQILRTCLSLSALTGRPVEIVRIRAGRSRPGLQPQHLASVKAAAGLCAASLEGAEIGSVRLRFAPQAPPTPGAYHFAIGTAGATALVLQTVLMPLAFAPTPPASPSPAGRTSRTRRRRTIWSASICRHWPVMAWPLPCCRRRRGSSLKAAGW